jgi:CBS domain containing-hemolysin-like protein
VVTNSAVAAVLCLLLLGEGRELYATLLLSPFVVLLGEMVPKAYFRHHADRLVPLLAPPLSLCLRLFAPLSSIIRRASNFLLTPLQLSSAERGPYITREEFKFLVQEGNHQAELDTEERRMIHKIIDFGETTVDEAMIPSRWWRFQPGRRWPRPWRRLVSITSLVSLCTRSGSTRL